MSSEQIVVLPADEFASGAAVHIARTLRAIARARSWGTGDGDAGAGSRISLALAGGRTPVPVYRRLAALDDVPWPRIDVWFADERAVPPDHSDSNYRMARETLLDHVPLGPGRVRRMEAEREDREAVARAYAAILPLRIDLLLLGLGTDGHVASLFPGAPALAEQERRVVPARSPEPPSDRLTVTPPVIRDARRKILLVSGMRKAAAVRAALLHGGPTDACPARMIHDAEWILDDAAAVTLELAPH